MGLSHSPSIVMDGLILCLDPGNNRSYPGSSSAFTDLSLSSNNATLANNPTFSSNNGGYFSFDGTDDLIYTSILYTNNPQNFTLCLYFRTSSASGKKLIGFENSQSGTATNYDRQLYVGTNGKVIFGIHPGGVQIMSTTTSVNDNTWRYVAATYDGLNSTVYINGIGETTRTFAYAQSYNGYWRIGSAALGGWPNSNTGSFVGDIAQVQIYNRALSAAEIKQNYNATKKRYGL